MRVLLDVQPLQTQSRDRGIGRYVALLLAALSARTDVAVVPVYNPLDGPAPVVPGTPAALALDGPSLAGSFSDADVYHVSSPFEEPGGRVVFPAGAEVMLRSITVHDVIPFEFADRYFVDAWTRRRFEVRAEMIRNADVALSVSRHSARMATELVGVDAERIAVVGEGVDPYFVRPRTEHGASHIGDPETPPLHGSITRAFVLAVGSGEERKNIERLIRAFALVAPDVRRRHQLVVACRLSEHDRRRWEAEAEAAGLVPGELVLTGGVTDAELRALYRRAALFVMPSWAEGFGLPVAEAVSCGCPAITSSSGALPEILELDESMFDAFSEPGMAALVARGLTDESFRARLLRAGRAAEARLDWSLVADRMVAAWRRALTVRIAPRPARRLSRIALVGPFGGSATGIGAYNSRLHEAFGSGAEAVAFVDRSDDPTAWGQRCRSFPALSMGRSVAPANFDHRVYVLGNSRAHRQTMSLARTLPGHVWLHEAMLAGYHLGVANRDMAPEHRVPYLRRALDEAYGMVLPNGPRRYDDFLDADRYQSLGLRMLAPVVTRAKSVIVSSPLAMAQIRADVRYPSILPPMTVIPLAFPSPSPARLRPARRVVGVVGRPGSVKDPIRTLSVLQGMIGSIDEVAFIGAAPDDALRATIERAAAHAGLGAAIRFTGYLPDVSYAEAIGGLRVAVQLRAAANGEMSAAVADLVAAGTPVITDLESEARFAGPGLFVGDPGSVAGQQHLRLLLEDDDAWVAASEAALATAGSWSFADVAQALTAWLETLPG